MGIYYDLQISIMRREATQDYVKISTQAVKSPINSWVTKIGYPAIFIR